MRQMLTIALVVAVLLAGCSAGPVGDVTTGAQTSDGADATTPGDDGSADGSTSGQTTPADGSSGDDGTGDDGASGDSGVDFYLSDRPSAIDDFDHLNVTVTKVGIHRAGNGSGGGEWLEYDVNATVDLTRLQGANASKIGSFDLPNGSYTKVFVYVSDTRGEMNGNEQRVKLPSGKLQLNKGFTVGQGDPLDFVFDITVHKAGKSGKYVLSPVVSESGTSDEVEIRDVDREDESENEDQSEETVTPESDGERTETAAPATEPTATATGTDASETETAAPTTETDEFGGGATPGEPTPAE